jgi:hypothetical protein
MTSATIRSKNPGRKMPVSQQQPTVSISKNHILQISPYEDLYVLIAKRAYDFYRECGARQLARCRETDSQSDLAWKTLDDSEFLRNGELH